jgi:hypothetical protein
MGSMRLSPSLVHVFSRPVRRFVAALAGMDRSDVVYIIAKYRFFDPAGLFVSRINPYHLGAAFKGRPGINTRPTTI